MPPSGPSRLPLTERVRPTHLEELIGNPRARADLRAWADRWRGERLPSRRAAVLSGPAGVGKTTAAWAVANDLGWTVVEMNASDARNERAIERVAGRASVTHTLDERSTSRSKSRALILLDEADCLTGRAAESSPTKRAPPSLREYLRGRYRSIESLNAAYGLKPSTKPAPFKDWESVPRSPGNYAWARLPAARADIEDWRSSAQAPDVSDRGGMAAIARLVRGTLQPVVLTVNDEEVLTRYSPIFRNSVTRIRFYPVRYDELRPRLDQIARSEKIRLAPGVIEAIVQRAQGDVRAALNDLEAIAPIEAGPLQLSVLGARDLGADLAAMTEEALSAPRFYRSVEVQSRLDTPPDDLLPWIEENLPHFAPDAERRADAFEVLATAERFLMHARRARVWSQWSYASELLTGGVGLALRDRPIPRSNGAAFPRFLSEMGRSKAFRATRDALTAKASTRFHLSRRKGREVVVPFLERIFASVAGVRRSPEFGSLARAIASELELTPEEVAFLVRREPDSREVHRILGPPEADETEERSDAERDPSPNPSGGARPKQRQLSEFGG